MDNQQAYIKNISKRCSGIELLKLVAMFVIVVSHVVQSLEPISSELTYPFDTDYTLEFRTSSQSCTLFCLALLRHLGPLGNDIFFICSAWFLVDSYVVKKEKIINFLLDVWLISVLLLIIFLFAGYRLDFFLLLKQIFPTLFNNTWYVTCYIMIYAMHPWLNYIMNKMERAQLLNYTFLMLFLYFGIGYLIGTPFYSNALILFITMYFLIGYLKKYQMKLISNRKMMIGLIVAGISLDFLIMLVTNVLGLKLSYFGNYLYHWCSNESPFILMIAIGVFGVFSQYTFNNKVINKISTLTLYVYLIHENDLVRKYWRREIWYYIYHNLTYKYLFGEILIFSMIILVISLIMGWIYRNTVHNLGVKGISKIHKYVKFKAL